jgi:hypothetical protein
MRLHWRRLDPLGRGAELVDLREHALDEWLPVRGVWNITSTWPIFRGHRAGLEAAVARRVVEIRLEASQVHRRAGLLTLAFKCGQSF